MKKTIFYTGPWNNGIRPHGFMRLLSEYYYKRKMCSGCGKAYNKTFGLNQE
jgi:hypothetical protein